jgi:hypothetical protein
MARSVRPALGRRMAAARVAAEAVAAVAPPSQQAAAAVAAAGWGPASVAAEEPAWAPAPRQPVAAAGPQPGGLAAEAPVWAQAPRRPAPAAGPRPEGQAVARAGAGPRPPGPAPARAAASGLRCTGVARATRALAAGHLRTPSRRSTAAAVPPRAGRSAPSIEAAAGSSDAARARWPGPGPAVGRGGAISAMDAAPLQSRRLADPQ